MWSCCTSKQLSVEPRPRYNTIQYEFEFVRDNYLTIHRKVHDFAEAGPDSVHSLAQVKSLVVLLHPSKDQGPVRVYPEILGVLVRHDIAIVSRLLAAGPPPRDRRGRKSVRVAVEHQPRHPLGGTDILGLHHPTGWHCFAASRIHTHTRNVSG